MANSKETKAIERYENQQRRSRKAQNRARKEQKSKDFKSNAEKTGVNVLKQLLAGAMTAGLLSATGGASAPVLSAAARAAAARKLYGKGFRARRAIMRNRNR